MTQQPTMMATFTEWKDQGGRGAMEDDTLIGTIDLTQDVKMQYFCLMDGHAGFQSVEIIKKILPRVLQDTLQKVDFTSQDSGRKEMVTVLRQLPLTLDQQLYDALEYKHSSGTTFSLVVYHPKANYAVACNVGDSTIAWMMPEEKDVSTNNHEDHTDNGDTKANDHDEVTQVDEGSLPKEKMVALSLGNGIVGRSLGNGIPESKISYESTIGHNLITNQLELTRVKSAIAKNHDYYFTGSHVMHRLKNYGINLSRALGDFPLKYDNDIFTTNDIVIANPDVHLIENPTYMIMHSDGFDNCGVKEATLNALFQRLLQGDSATMIGNDILKTITSDNGGLWGQDNMSCITIKMIPSPTQEVQSEAGQGRVQPEASRGNDHPETNQKDDSIDNNPNPKRKFQDADTDEVGRKKHKSEDE